MKVYESEVGILLPAARADDTVVPITVAPVPLESVALWKTLLKLVPVEALPMFEIVSVKEVAEFTVAEAGVIRVRGLIQRSGKDGLETDAELVQVGVTELPFEVTVTEAVLVPAVEYILLTF